MARTCKESPRCMENESRLGQPLKTVRGTVYYYDLALGRSSRFIPEDYVSELSMANPIHAPSTNPQLPSGRPQLGNIDDQCTLETISTRRGRVTKPSSPRTSVAHTTDKRRRKHHSQTPRGRQTPSSQVVHYEDSSRFSLLSGEPSYSTSPRSPRGELKRTYSSPMVLPTPNTRGDGDTSMGLEASQPLTPSKSMTMGPEITPATESKTSPSQADTEYDMVKQLTTNPITHEQLVPEVRSIYRGLAMVEEKCIKLDKEQSESKEDLSRVQWQALISIHSTLLHEHHDFFLSSQHPVARNELTELAEKYTMPARMWRYGIHSLLELLRHKLPGSLEYMLHFIYIAYSMVTLLLENIPYFRETWIECLGDLARYRMAIEESDMRDREVWASVSQYWYNQEADLSPDVGRVQHHLAVLARPDALAQLFYYTKALLCRRPFHNARDSIRLLFNSFRDQSRQDSMPAALIATHGVLFHNGPSEQFVVLANNYLRLLDENIPRLERSGQDGAFVMSSNLAAILQYGESNHDLALEFPPRKSQSTAEEIYQLALQWTTPAPAEQDTADPFEITSKISSPVAFQGSALAFHSMGVFLDQFQDPNTTWPAIHTALSFVLSLAIHPLAMEKHEPMIPWLKIIRFLNVICDPFTDFEKIEGDAHPRFPEENERIRAKNNDIIEREQRERERKGTKRSERNNAELHTEIPNHLPEDFLIRGQVWSELYYPEDFFNDGPLEHDRSFVDPQLLEMVRRHRCLWIGVRLSRFNRWITYDRSRPRRFEPTSVAIGYASFAKSSGGLQSDFEIQEEDVYVHESDHSSDCDFDMDGA